MHWKIDLSFSFISNFCALEGLCNKPTLLRQVDSDFRVVSIIQGWNLITSIYVRHNKLENVGRVNLV